MRISSRISLPFFVLALLSVWSGVHVIDVMADTTGEISVTGTATYRERIMLPPNAVFEAAVLDTSRADVASIEVGKVTMTDLPAPPINFSIPVDSAKIDQRKVYTVRTQIRVGEKLVFTSDSAYPVLTRGAGKHVDILLKKVPGKRKGQTGIKPNAPLVNTYWKIVTLEGETVSTAAGKREPHLLLKNIDNQKKFAATVGCNQLMGGFSLAGEKITFAAPMSTMMACPPPFDALEKHLGRVLSGTRGWRVSGETLELLDDNGSPVALFEAVYF